MELTPEQRRFFRDQLREARAIALLDAEGFHPIVTALERLGSMLRPNGRGLGEYREVLLPIANDAQSRWTIEGPRDIHTPVDVLYTAVVDGRNDALHQGAYARHLVGHCVELALLVEEGLMGDEKSVADFMVRDPACAEPWQPVGLARHRMLMSSFSYLPIRINDEWKLISDHAIASYLSATDNRRQALAQRIEVAHASGKLLCESAQAVPPNTSVREALEKSAGKPVLVVADGRLLGIAAPFDLL